MEAGSIPVGAADIEQRLRDIIVRALRLSKRSDEIDGADLVTEVGVTSIDALEVLINVEMEFGIEIADEDLNLRLVSSLPNLTSYVAERVAHAT
jgi:acyl carrier protein